MSIEFKNSKFHLFNNEMSYVIEVSPYNDLLHLYYGAKITPDALSVPCRCNNPFIPNHDENNPSYTLGSLPCEYPTAGGADFRSPAIEAELPNGLRAIRLKYTGHEILPGKPALPGLPAVYTESDAEASTLKIITEDEHAGIQVILYYTIFEDINAICRHTEIKNKNNLYAYIRNAQSVSIDFPAGEYDYIHLSGAWARERHVERNAVHKGIQGFESRRGASGHTENPFIALLEKGAGEDCGNVYGFSLVYSGNHRFVIESEAFETPRVQAGINPFSFCYKLEEGESLVTPEAVMVYSASGLGEMSRTYHRLYRTRLCRGKYRDLPRPILVNNWEGTYFNFTREKLLSIADSAAKIGVELFVLDDGWFGERDDDTTSLGDWFVNEKKLGGTIASLAEEMNKRGLKFGLWFEPEMISERSRLYEKHPEWAIQIPGQKPHYSRHQFILDYTRADVREYIVKTISDVLSKANIEYVKWDMNRNMSDVYSPQLAPDKQGEFYHRYILGLYEVLERITSAFPDVLFESCSGGGGRFDPGMLYYMPQCWTSDDTDAVERLYIQYGTSLVYPASSMGAHVSAVPNHQVGRITPLSMRAAVAMNGAFGYELDLSKLPEEELAEMAEQIKLYKKIRGIVSSGNMYRLLDPFTSRYASWMYVSEDKKTALVYYAVARSKPVQPLLRIRLKGLDPDLEYSIDGKLYTGSTLMNYGIVINRDEHAYDNLLLEIHSV
ncbi:MAG: alpha-galactosidase [Clostridia bacterium]|nr:alpha-galactosidase [Clostridia bacterium]